MIKTNMQPGYDGGMELTSRQVDNPYRKGESEVVAFNARESNAKTLRLGPAQTRAYDRFWELFYKMGHNRQLALDPSHEPVDGGGMKDPIQSQAIEAGQELHQLQQSIGRDRYTLIVFTCIDGMNYSQVAMNLYGRDHSKQEMQEASVSVKNAYSAAMYHFGYAKPNHTIAKLMSYGDRAELRPEMWEGE